MKTNATKKLFLVVCAALMTCLFVGCFNPLHSNETNAQIFADYYDIDCENTDMLDNYINYWINFNYNGEYLFSSTERNSISKYTWYYMNKEYFSYGGQDTVYGLTVHFNESVWICDYCKEKVIQSEQEEEPLLTYTVLHEMIHCTYKAGESHSENYVNRSLEAVEMLFNAGAISENQREAWSNKFQKYL